MNLEHESNERILMALEMSGFIERSTLARTIELLIEVERRRLDLELSYSSMYDFCIRRLGFSEDEAYRRLACARLVVTFPAILAPLREGRVTLTNIVLTRDLFTAENVDALIAEIAGKTRKEVEVLVARHRPKPDVPDSIRRLEVQAALVVPPLDPTPMPAATQRAQAASEKARPLAEDRFAFAFTAPATFGEKVEKLRGLSPPVGDSLAALLEWSLDVAIAEREKRMLRATKNPRKSRPSKDASYISAATRRDVAARDERQCTFVSADGVRCTAREHLELDHRQPRARGGAGDAANIRTLCSAHNRYEAEKAFGREHIERSIRAAEAKRRATTSTPVTSTASQSAAPATTVTTGTECASSIAASDPVAKPSESDGQTRASSVAASRPVVTPEDDAKKRASLRYALVEDLGFKSADVDRRITSLAADHTTWSRPLASLVVEAVRDLSEKRR